MSRLVVVSNRVGPIRDAARAGGLAVALVDALKREGGLWYGWSGNVAETSGETHIEQHGPLTLATNDLTEPDYQEYYNGFANSALWPLFHYRLDLASFDRRNYQGYMRVNQRFARDLAPLLRPDDLIWVHDYHFIPFGEELRRLGCKQRIGFFLHIPFPAPEVLTVLPRHETLIRSLFAYDLIGFQTGLHRRAFLHYVEDEAGGRVLDEDHVRAFGRTIRASVFSIGIDTDNFVRFTSSADGIRHYERMRETLQDRTQIIGVDRLDYSKGLPQRFEAVECLFEHYPENCGRVTFLQIAPPSRSDVEEYIQIRRQLEMAAGHINGRFSQYDWTPVRYLNRAFSRRALSGLYRASKVGLVTPLRDGMNLVAKEYVAAQDPDDPGVLVLSRFAGAVGQLPGALIVNPYDVEGVANCLQQALHMPHDERQDRWSAMMARLRKEDVDTWRNAFLSALRAVELQH